MVVGEASEPEAPTLCRRSLSDAGPQPQQKSKETNTTISIMKDRNSYLFLKVSKGHLQSIATVLNSKWFSPRPSFCHQTTVAARKLEHHYPHSFKVKYKGS